MKTLAALTANGFGAVYIEVVSVIVVDQLGLFFFFPLLSLARFPLTAIIHSEVFHRHCHVCESRRDRDSV